MRATFHSVLLVLFLVWKGPFLLHAQPQQYEFERLDSRDGLSHNTVLSILQDRQGYLWVGTVDGLNRYDGYHFVPFRHDPQDTTSLSGSNVNVLLEDQDGQLWVSTPGGLNRLDRATGRFAHYHPEANDEGQSRVYARALDPSGDLWVKVYVSQETSRLYRYDRQAQVFRRYQNQPGNATSLAPGVVGPPVMDHNGVMVGVFTRQEGTVTFNEYDPAHDRFYRVELPGSHIDADRPYFPQAYRGRSGVLWIWTAFPERLAAQTNRLRPLPALPGGPILKSDIGRRLLEDQQGRLWIGTIGQGLYRYDPAAGTLRHHLVDTSRTAWLSNSIQDIYEDRAGTIWVGTLSGLYRYDPHRKPFRHLGPGTGLPTDRGSHTVMAVHEEADGVLWAGTLGGGLLRVDRARGTTTRYDQCGDLVWTVYEDRAGTLWIIGDELCALDRHTGRFTRYGTPAGLQIAEDQTGRLWVILSGRLHRGDPGTGILRAVADVPPGTFAVLHVDRHGTLWIRSKSNEGGLFCYHPETHVQGDCPVDGLVASPESALTLHEDAAGLFWLGTSRGLLRLDPSTRQLVQVARLPGNKVFSILEDDQERLWMGTSRGLLRYDKRTERFRHYGLNEGVGNLEFNRRAVFKSPRGEFFFGGLDGITAFYPEAIEDNPYVPPVVVTHIQKENRDGTIALNPERARRDGLVLAPRDYSFSFEFAALNFTLPEENQYAYMLEGVDEGWVEAGTRRFARYVGIPQGDYIFRVKGSNNDGVWNEEGASIRLRVLPPFWQTGWFRLLAIAAVLGMAYAGYRWRIRDLEARSRMLETQVAERTAEVRAQAEKLQELDRVKSRFFANISHEFRTPLTLMLGPLRDVLDGAFGDVDERLQDQHRMMQRNGRRLLRLINQLLDLSRLEAGNLTIRSRRADLVPLVRATTQAFASMARRKDITLQVDVPQPEIPLYFEPDKIEKILYNLLSNAFKFTPEHGTIEVRVEESAEEAEGFIEIVVRDTGRGIPPEELPYIFDRFHQVDASSTREQEGSGIGLALTKELVALHGGTIRVESEEGFGTAFFVRLPKGRAHLSDDDIVGTEDRDAVLEVVDTGASLQAIDDMLASEERLFEHAGDGKPAEVPPEDAPTILVVEDNADVRGYLRSHLVADYHVVEAVDGLEGLERAREHVPDLVLADVMMPRLDGYGLCRAVKADETLNHIPVVLLTAKADEESKIEGLETGADDYLYKPFNAEELLVRVENLIEIRRQLRVRYSETVLVQPSAIEVTSEEVAFLERVREVVERQMGNSHFSAERLADEVGLSRRQLDRRLKTLVKLSASGFIRQMRLQRAAQLLEQQAGRVSEVAYAVGFQSAEHFSKLFQQVFGVAPSRYGADHTQSG